MSLLDQEFLISPPICSSSCSHPPTDLVTAAHPGLAAWARRQGAISKEPMGLGTWEGPSREGTGCRPGSLPCHVENSDRSPFRVWVHDPIQKIRAIMAPEAGPPAPRGFQVAKLLISWRRSKSGLCALPCGESCSGTEGSHGNQVHLWELGVAFTGAGIKGQEVHQGRRVTRVTLQSARPRHSRDPLGL